MHKRFEKYLHYLVCLKHNVISFKKFLYCKFIKWIIKSVENSNLCACNIVEVFCKALSESELPEVQKVGEKLIVKSIITSCIPTGVRIAEEVVDFPVCKAPSFHKFIGNSILTPVGESRLNQNIAWLIGSRSEHDIELDTPQLEWERELLASGIEKVVVSVIVSAHLKRGE